MSQLTQQVKPEAILTKLKKLIAKNVKIVPSLTTMLLFIIAFIVGGIIWGGAGFFTLRNFFSLFTDNAHLLISAMGMTFIIISGGIDLSVGSVAALSTMIIATGNAFEHGPEMAGWGWPMWLCIVVALVAGTLLGFIMGVLIQVFEVPPFIATLAGMFFARGLCFIISVNSIPIEDPGFRAIGSWNIQIRDVLNFNNPNAPVRVITIGVLLFLILLIFSIIMMRSTKFGRNVYAIGGNEQSAKLMGLPVGKTRIFAYTFNGFCSALAGIAFAFSLNSGFGRHLIGMELDVIASVVIGGALLSGGIGYPLGSVFGVLTHGTIRKYVSFGAIRAGYSRIIVGVILLLFVIMQRLVIMIAEKNKEA